MRMVPAANVLQWILQDKQLHMSKSTPSSCMHFKNDNAIRPVCLSNKVLTTPYLKSSVNSLTNFHIPRCGSVQKYSRNHFFPNKAI